MKYGQPFLERVGPGTADFRRVIAPTISSIVAAAAGKRVVDLGCGEGRFSRHFAAAGARVVGIDSSTSQLNRALEIENQSSLGIRYLRADFLNDQLSDLDEAFDIALLMFVVLDQPAPGFVRRALERARTLVAQGGAILLADVHPHCFDRPNSFEHSIPHSGYGYFDNGTPFSSTALLENGGYVTFRPNFHYRLDFLLNSIAETGLRLTRLIEPDSGVGFPTHLILLAQK